MDHRPGCGTTRSRRSTCANRGGDQGTRPRRSRIAGRRRSHLAIHRHRRAAHKRAQHRTAPDRSAPQRTGKLADVLAVELELGRVRGEIERMEAEKKSLINRVDFATLNATIREDYQALVPVGPFSMLARFRNAAVEGYRSTVESVVDVIAFLLSNGPVLLVWAAILFFPARFVWRRVRRNPSQQ